MIDLTGIFTRWCSKAKTTKNSFFIKYILFVDGRAVETLCGKYGHWRKDCCNTCFWSYGGGSGAWMSECLETLSGSRWANRRKADYHCRRVKYDGPFYCDWDRKKRSATSNQTIVPPMVSGIKKDIIPTNFKTRTWMSGKNRKPPIDPDNPESNHTITWMSGIRKKWNLKGKKTITWDAGVPRDRNPPNITDAAFNQMLTNKQQRWNDFNCGSSPSVDINHCARRVRTRSQMRVMQCPCCYVSFINNYLIISSLIHHLYF